MIHVAKYSRLVRAYLGSYLAPQLKIAVGIIAVILCCSWLRRTIGLPWIAAFLLSCVGITVTLASQYGLRSRRSRTNPKLRPATPLIRLLRKQWDGPAGAVINLGFLIGVILTLLFEPDPRGPAFEGFIRVVLFLCLPVGASLLIVSNPRIMRRLEIWARKIHPETNAHQTRAVRFVWRDSKTPIHMALVSSADNGECSRVTDADGRVVDPPPEWLVEGSELLVHSQGMAHAVTVRFNERPAPLMIILEVPVGKHVTLPGR